MTSKANRRSIRSAGHRLFILLSSALVAYGRFDRRVDADVIASGLSGDLARIPPHLPIPLQFARPAGRAGSGRPICGERHGIRLGKLVEALPAGLPPALGAFLVKRSGA
jgi:hypothetical protein